MGRRAWVQVVIVALLFIVLISMTADKSARLFALNNSQPTQTNASNLSLAFWMGDGYSYTGYINYQNTIPNANLAIKNWSLIIANFSTPPTDYKDKFEWNVIKLGFQFPNLFPNSIGNINGSRDRDMVNLSLPVMNAVINYLYSRGFSVVLSDYDWNSFGSPTWVQDWVNVTQYFKGDQKILGFDLYNEPGCWPSKGSCTWDWNNVTTYSYNSTEGVESALYNTTVALRQVDPTRTVIWYGPYMQWTIAPQFQLSNVAYDFHLYNGNNPPSQSWITESIDEALTFGGKYSVPVVCLELDSGENTTLGIYTITSLEQDKIAWIDWDYSQFMFTYWWIPILDGAPGLNGTTTNSSSSSTTTTLTTTTTRTTTSTSTDTTTSTSTTTVTTTSTDTTSSTITSTSTQTSTSTSTETTTSTSTITSTSTVTSTSNTTSTSTVTSTSTETNTTTVPTTTTTTVTTNGGSNGTTTTLITTSTSTASSSVSTGGVLGLDPKKVTALTYGSSTSIVVFALGFIFGIVLRNRRLYQKPSGSWRW